MKMFARLNPQGVACAETAICEACVKSPQAKEKVEEQARAHCFPPDDRPDDTYVDCSLNDILECQFCGRLTLEQPFESTISVCAHSVKIRYWGFDCELTQELIDILTEEGESRAHDCIVEGYHSGELCCCYFDGETEQEIFGWWEIE